MPPVCIPPTDACKRPKLVQNVKDWHIAARHCPARHMPHHQATQLLSKSAALCRLQIIHQREDVLALGGVSWDEKRNHYEAQDVGVLIGEVDQHVRPQLVERAAAQPGALAACPGHIAKKRRRALDEGWDVAAEAAGNSQAQPFCLG